MINHARIGRLLLLVVAGVMIVSSTGCIGAMAQILYVIRGHKTPAEFEGLAGKKIAVVVVSDASAYGADTLTYTVGKAISIDLANNLKKSSVVPPSRIEAWMDQNGFEESDFLEIGRGVDAEMVVAVEVGSYTIHDGATMFKGQSDLTVSVYDVKRDQMVFSKGPREFVFPKTGRPRIQTSDRKFEQFYLARMTKHISHLFYSHDQLDSIAEEAAMPSF